MKESMQNRLVVICAVAGFGAAMSVMAAQPAAPQSAPAPVQEGSAQESSVAHYQRRATAARNEWQKAEYEAKLAEQDWLNAEAAYKREQQQIGELKASMDKAAAAREAARKKVADKRAEYDNAVNAVDQAMRKPAAK